jgi:triosephosphate isomerase
MGVVALSLKMYLGHERTLELVDAVLARLARVPAVGDGRVRVAILPSFLSIPALAQRLNSTPILLGAQDLCQADHGPYTGEVSGPELARFGVSVVEVGHAERRFIYGESDEMVRDKLAAAARNGLIPLLCVGGTDRATSVVATAECIQQVTSALGESRPDELWIAYEPWWAIRAPEPAPADHVREVCEAIRASLTYLGLPVVLLYGGSAGPGLLTRLGNAVDGLFLGRFGHDPAAFEAVVCESAPQDDQPVDLHEGAVR